MSLPRDEAALVESFTPLMRQKLAANSHKPSWREETVKDLFLKLKGEVRELGDALGIDHDSGRPLCAPDTEAARLECADVANFAAMIADVLGAKARGDLLTIPAAPAEDRAAFLAAKEPRQPPRNQCDGCMAGIPVDANGNHRMGTGVYPNLQGCRAAMYLHADPPTPDAEATARRIVERIESDLTGRSGCDWNFDEEIKDEIRASWLAIVLAGGALSAAIDNGRVAIADPRARRPPWTRCGSGGACAACPSRPARGATARGAGSAGRTGERSRSMGKTTRAKNVVRAEAADEARTRPILFSAPMVRALLAGTKTQTRRVVKPQPQSSTPGVYPDRYNKQPNEWAFWLPDQRMTEARTWACPYGAPGDRLRVRESWRTTFACDLTKPSDLSRAAKIWYEADGDAPRIQRGRCRPGIFLPTWASRITLEITTVRVERAQAISEADAKAEGAEPCGGFMASAACWTNYAKNGPSLGTAKESFATLWAAINGAESWAANPWVWCISFRRVA